MLIDRIEIQLLFALFTSVFLVLAVFIFLIGRHIDRKKAAINTDMMARATGGIVSASCILIDKTEKRRTKSSMDSDKERIRKELFYEDVLSRIETMKADVADLKNVSATEDDELRGIIRERDEIKRKIGMLQKKFYSREIDESMFRDLFKKYESELVDVEVRMERSRKGKR